MLSHRAFCLQERAGGGGGVGESCRVEGPWPEAATAAWHATVHGYAKRHELVTKHNYNNVAKSFRQRANLTQNFKIRTKLT